MKESLKRALLWLRQCRANILFRLMEANGPEGWLYRRLTWKRGERVRLVSRSWPGADRSIPYRVMRVRLDCDYEGPHVGVSVDILDDRLRDDEERSGGGYKGLYVGERDLVRWVES